MNAGSTATFTIVTTNGNVTGYQWYRGATVLSDGATDFGVVSGSQTATLTIENVSTKLNGAAFKAVMTGGSAPLSSLPGQLTVVQGTLVKFDVPDVGTMVVELFDHDKPVTVQNFLRYVQTRDPAFTNFYANTFFTRLEQNFVLQGGGYAPYPMNLSSPFTNSYFIADVALATLSQIGGGILWYVHNESTFGPHVRNTFGTLAMATPAGSPDRGRAEWFFNLADNSGDPHNLDTSNGGYAVFGRVIRGLDVLTNFNQLPSNQIVSHQVTYQITDTTFGTNVFPTLPVKTTDANNVYVSDLFFVNISLISKPAIDFLKPTLKITYPPANAKLTNADFTLRGTSSDNIGVAGVYCQDLYYHAVGPDQRDDDEALLQHVVVNGTTNWSADVHLFPGPWLLIMTAYDGHGNLSQTSERFVIESPLTVATNGSGKITPNLNGQWLSPESRYTMTATPAPGHLFAYWSGVRDGETWMFPNNDASWAFDITDEFKVGPESGTNVATPTLTFTMYTNLTITANFVSNYFPVVQGNYYGLVAPTDHNDITVTNTGLCKIVSTGLGTFSGSLSIQGKIWPFAGKWDYAGHVTNLKIPRLGTTPLIMNASIDLSNNLNTITGTVAGADWTSDLNATNSVKSLTSATTPAVGSYVMRIPSQSSDLGDSYATITATATGMLNFSGVMSDNTPWSESVGVSRDGGFPIFSSLYGGRGLVVGLQQFSSPTNSIGATRWIRPSIATAFYTNGFSTPAFYGYISAYKRPVVNTTYVLRLSGNTLQPEVDYGVKINALNQFVTTSGGGPRDHLVLTLTGATGALSGSWSDPALGTWTIKGVLGTFDDPNVAGTGFILGPHGQTGFMQLVFGP